MDKMIGEEKWEKGFKSGLIQARDILDMAIQLEEKGLDPFDILQDKLTEKN